MASERMTHQRHSTWPRRQAGRQVEGLMVISLVGIIVAIAAGSYSQHPSLEEQVGRMLLERATPATSQVESFYQGNRRLPGASTTAGGIPGVVIGQGGIIRVTLAAVSSNFEGGTVWLTPEVQDGTFRWRCRGALEDPSDTAYLPSACRFDELWSSERASWIGALGKALIYVAAFIVLAVGCVAIETLMNRKADRARHTRNITDR